MFRRSPKEVSATRGQRTVFMALAAAFFSFVAINNILEHPARAPINLGLWSLWLTVVLGWVFGVPGGFGYSRQERDLINDELVRSHQAAAAKFGLVCCLAALLAISAIVLTRGDLPVWVVPAATSGSVVMTGLFFAWLQMRHD